MRSPEQQPDDDLRDLVSRLIGNEENAWREFVDRFAPPMYAYFRRDFAAAHETAEDLTAETLRRITRSVARFRYRTAYQFKAWLFAIARNVGIDHIRRAPPECALPDYLQDIAAVLLEPEAEAELVTAVHESVAQLPAASRRVVELRYFQGLDPQDIAAQT